MISNITTHADPCLQFGRTPAEYLYSCLYICFPKKHGEGFRTHASNIACETIRSSIRIYIEVRTYMHMHDACGDKF